MTFAILSPYPIWAETEKHLNDDTVIKVPMEIAPNGSLTFDLPILADGANDLYLFDPPEVEALKPALFSSYFEMILGHKSKPEANSAMQAADLATISFSRYRDCISCHESFRFKSPDDWYCPVCRGLESQRQHEQERGEALNVANGKFK